MAAVWRRVRARLRRWWGRRHPLDCACEVCEQMQLW